MPPIDVDNNLPLDVEIDVETVAIVRFIAQRRVPGGDFIDFATAADSSASTHSHYLITLAPPIIAHTDFRIVFLIDGPAGRRYDISVRLKQNALDVHKPLHLTGTIGDDGNVVYAQLDAELV